MPRSLVARAGALGDLLLLRRAIASLRAAGHEVVLLAPEHAGRALLGDGPGDVQSLVPWDGAAARHLWRGPEEDGTPAALLGCGLALAYTRDADLLRGLASRIPRVLGHDPEPQGRGHASAWLCEPLGPLGLDIVPAAPTQVPDAAEAAAAAPILDQLPARFLAVHPGSGSAAKNWPVERFAALVSAVSGGRSWLLVKGAADADACAALQGLAGAVVAAALPARVLGAILARAGRYVGNDSGVSHLAAAWGAPTVALFGPTDPDVWGPQGTNVRVLRSPTARMEDLGMEDVLSHLT